VGAEKAISKGCATRLKPRDKERFLSAQADPFAGAKGKEKASACSVRNDRKSRVLSSGYGVFGMFPGG
jgi:hypothetical protein